MASSVPLEVTIIPQCGLRFHVYSNGIQSWDEICLWSSPTSNLRRGTLKGSLDESEVSWDEKNIFVFRPLEYSNKVKQNKKENCSLVDLVGGQMHIELATRHCFVCHTTKRLGIAGLNSVFHLYKNTSSTRTLNIWICYKIFGPWTAVVTILTPKISSISLHKPVSV